MAELPEYRVLLRCVPAWFGQDACFQAFFLCRNRQKFQAPETSLLRRRRAGGIFFSWIFFCMAASHGGTAVLNVLLFLVLRFLNGYVFLMAGKRFTSNGNFICNSPKLRSAISCVNGTQAEPFPGGRYLLKRFTFFGFVIR